MLNRIRSLLWSRRRKIFRFWDGHRTRAVDPVSAAIALKEHPSFLRRHLREAMEGDIEAQKIVAATACDVFDAKPLDAKGRGLSTAERIELVMGFDLYLSALKKNSRSSVIPPSSTELTSPASAEPTTPPMSASG